MNDGRIKATDYLIESLKQIFSLATIFFVGLLAYRSTLSSHELNWTYYTALGLLAACSLFSVVNINSLISKIYRGEDAAIYTSEAKFLNCLVILLLGFGLGFAAYFFSNIGSNDEVAVGVNQSMISDDKVVVDGNVQSNIEIVKDDSGKIKRINIKPGE